MKIKVGDGRKNSEGVYVHTVTVEGENFEDVKNIRKYKNCDSDNCKYYRKCSYDNGVVRMFDCEKNRTRLIFLYTTITGIFAAVYFSWLFTIVHPGFFKGIAYLIFGLVALDIICTIIEIKVPKLRDKRFYKILKKTKKRKEAKKRKEEEMEQAKIAAEEFKKIADSPYYNEVLKAASTLNALKTLSDENDFGKNNEKISHCVEKVSEIIEVLKKDSSGYVRVALLFEGTLEEFYSTLKLYTCFLKADVKDEKNDRILTGIVNDFYNYLSNQKIDATFDQDSIGIQFRSSAETLRTMISKKGEN